MVYVYRGRNSDSAKLLADGLQGDRLRIFNNGTFQRREGGANIRPRRGDVIVCWGEDLPVGLAAGVRVLNGAAMLGKFAAAQRLKASEVATVEVAAHQPVLRPANPRFALDRNIEDALDRTTARRLIERLQRFIDTPDVPAQEWLPRINNHMGGHDLLNRPAAPDFWVKKEALIEEYRVHIFNGKSIRAGKKVHRDGFAHPHEWIRSYDGGWSIRYADFKSTKEMRALAARAVEVLGLQFGAVDLGKRADNSLIVLEVNRAAGLEGGTVTSYVDAISRWIEEA